MSTGMPYRDFCYMCAEPLAGSPQNNEHVIPANLFERGRKTRGLIVLPAHKKCNSEFSKDDENFRLALLSQAAPYNPVARKIWEGPTMRGFHRPDRPGLKITTLNNLKEVEVHTKAGVYLGSAEVMLQEPERLHRVLRRITRGLYANKTGSVLPADWPVSPYFVWGETAGPLAEAFSLRLVSVDSGGVFKYAHGRMVDDERETVFWMVFYEGIHVYGFTGNQIREAVGWDAV
jgi:hypothetical protein